MRKVHEIELLLAASRGNLYRLREHGKWSFYCSPFAGQINRNPVLDLMRRGFLEPHKIGLPGIRENLMVTIRGRQAMAEMEVPQR